MENLLPIFGLVTLGSLAGLVPGILLLARQQWAKVLSVHAIPFAAGVLLSVSLLDLLPEAIEQASPALVLTTVLLVMVGAFFFEQLFVHFHHHEEHRRTLVSSVPLIVLGDTIHNFVDGIAIVAAYLVEPSLGLLVALATFFHETPHELGDFGLMLAAGWKRAKVIWANIISALATYLGAALVLLFSAAFEQNLALVLAVAGGLFLYIGASDLLPEVHEDHRDKPWHQAGLLLAGVLLIWILTQFIPA